MRAAGGDGLLGRGRHLLARTVTTYRAEGTTRATRHLAGAVWRSTSYPVRRITDEYRTDRRLGIDSRGLTAAFASMDDGVYGYQATRRALFRRAIASLPIDPADYSFVDLGCGRGTALALAAEAGFRTVIGVELVPELLDAARRNVAAFADRFGERAGERAGHRARFELIEEDAGRFELPDGPTVVYLFNPFGVQTLRAVLAGVERAVESGRSVFVVYLNPVHEDVVSASPALHLVERRVGATTFGPGRSGRGRAPADGSRPG